MNLVIITMALRKSGAVTVASQIAGIALSAPCLIEHRIVWHHGAIDHGRERVAVRITDTLRSIPDGSWILAVDDDNLLHPDLPRRLFDVATTQTNLLAVAFGQKRPDFGGYLPPALPPVPGRIDGGQVALKAEHARLEPWRCGPTGDGEYLALLHSIAPSRWLAVDEPLTYHNAQRWM